jgi:hypothetical protein
MRAASLYDATVTTLLLSGLNSARFTQASCLRVTTAVPALIRVIVGRHARARARHHGTL